MHAHDSVYQAVISAAWVRGYCQDMIVNNKTHTQI